MNENELIDIFIIILPILILNLIFLLRNNLDFKVLKSKFLFVLISYSFLITTSIFILLIIFPFQLIGNKLVLHIHNSYSFVLSDITSFKADVIALLLIEWALSIFYSAFLLSQFSLRLLDQFLSDLSINTINPYDRIPPATILLLKRKNITLKMIKTTELGIIFSLSYLTIFRIRNIIYLHESIFSIYSDNEFNADLIHEIAHIYYRDTTIYPFFNILTNLLFLDYFLMKLKLIFRDRMEEKADIFAMKVINDSKDLARAIVKSLEIMNSTSAVSRFKYYNSSILPFKSSDKDVLTTRIEKIVNLQK